MITTTLLIVIFYIIPVLCVWKLVSISYSKGGSCDKSTPNFSDLVLVFTPIFNILFGMIMFCIYIDHKHTNNDFLFNFFKIKKE